MSCSLLPSLAVGRRSSAYERFQDESVGLLSLMVVGARFRDRAGDARSIAGGAVYDIGGAINTEFEGWTCLRGYVDRPGGMIAVRCEVVHLT